MGFCSQTRTGFVRKAKDGPAEFPEGQEFFRNTLNRFTLSSELMCFRSTRLFLRLRSSFSPLRVADAYQALVLLSSKVGEESALDCGTEQSFREDFSILCMKSSSTLLYISGRYPVQPKALILFL